MGKKNNVLLDYLNEPRRFADIFNGYFGKGEQIFDPKYIKEADSKIQSILVTKNGQRVENLEIMRDIKKIYKDDAILQILCLEDQDYIDYGAAIRTLKMDAAEYNNQLKKRQQKHREDNDLPEKEYECGISINDRFHPVITLWWYHGKYEYDGPYCLKDCLYNLDSPYNEFVSDYKLNILTTDENYTNGYFHTEFRNLYKTLACKNVKMSMKELFKKDNDFKDIDDDTLYAISVAIEMPTLWDNKDKSDNKRGGHDMCLAMEQIEEDARLEEKKKTISKMIAKGKSVEEIVDLLEYPEELVREVEESLFAGVH